MEFLIFGSMESLSDDPNRKRDVSKNLWCWITAGNCPCRIIVVVVADVVLVVAVGFTVVVVIVVLLLIIVVVVVLIVVVRNHVENLLELRVASTFCFIITKKFMLVSLHKILIYRYCSLILFIY